MGGLFCSDNMENCDLEAGNFNSVQIFALEAAFLATLSFLLQLMPTCGGKCFAMPTWLSWLLTVTCAIFACYYSFSSWGSTDVGDLELSKETGGYSMWIFFVGTIFS